MFHEALGPSGSVEAVDGHGGHRNEQHAQGEDIVTARSIAATGVAAFLSAYNMVCSLR